MLVESYIVKAVVGVVAATTVSSKVMWWGLFLPGSESVLIVGVVDTSVAQRPTSLLFVTRVVDRHAVAGAFRVPEL